MSAVEFILSSLVVWRATHMIFEELGPFGIFARLRVWAIKQNKQTGGIGDLIDCFLCLSVWIAGLLSLFTASNLEEFIIYTLGLSASAIFLNRVFYRLEP